MKVLKEGHKYELDMFENTPDNKENQTLQFIEKVLRKDSPSTSPLYSDPNELITLNNGTTNEEVLDMMIDRMYYLNKKFRSIENEIVIVKLEEALFWLNKRTNDRKKRGVEGKHIK